MTPETYSIALTGIYIASICAVLIRAKVKEKSRPRWRYYSDKDGAKQIKYRAYPVAVFDPDCGTFIMLAHTNINEPDKWRDVSTHEVCHPYAWFDLPYPKHPHMA